MINPWRATLSVNAGLALNTDGLRIWVDAVHDRRFAGYSTLTPQMQTRLFQSESFQNPDIVFFTHCHPDHFSMELCLEATKRFPQAKLILPEQRFSNQLLLRGQEVILRAGERLLSFRRLTHSGAQYEDVPHYSLLAEDGGESILVLGDCGMEGSELVQWVAGRQIDAVFAPFPWITLDHGRRLFKQVPCPRQLFIYHLPLAEDDDCHYIDSALKAAAEIRNICDVRVFTKEFQQERF